MKNKIALFAAVLAAAMVVSASETTSSMAVAAANAVARADIRRIMLFKASRGLPLEIPSALQHLVGSMHIGCIYRFQVQIFYHSVHS